MTDASPFAAFVSGSNDGRTVVSVQGEVDAASAPRIEEMVSSLLEDGTVRIVVDLRDCAFLDSSGLGAFVGVMKQLRDRGGNLTLACPRGPVARMLEISGLSRVMPVIDPARLGEENAPRR